MKNKIEIAFIESIKNHFNSLIDFFKSKKFGLHYRKIGERAFKLGPKNGHEITVLVGCDACDVRPSYYGTFYKPSKFVKDLEEYLKEYDFNSKPKVSHKFKPGRK